VTPLNVLKKKGTGRIFFLNIIHLSVYHIPLILSGFIIPSDTFVAVTIEHVIGSSVRTLISPNDCDTASLPITTCFIFFS
jgi:hypothetical protein